MIKMGFFDKIYNAVIVNANKQVSLRSISCVHFAWSGQSTNMCFIVSGTPEDSHVGWLLPSNK